MQYFSLVARNGRDRPRTCAMIRDITMEGARDKARTLLDSDHLAHVDRRDDFSIRRASRRETSLLQRYLSSKTSDHLSTYLQEDLDSLLSRRNSMVLSFFMALYFDQVALKRRLDGMSGPGSDPTPSPSGGEGSGGSGGRGTEQGVQEEEATQQDPDQSAGEATAEGEEMPVYDDQEAEEGAVGDGNQFDALAEIVSGGGDDQASTQDDEIDIF